MLRSCILALAAIATLATSVLVPATASASFAGDECGRMLGECRSVGGNANHVLERRFVHPKKGHR